MIKFLYSWRYYSFGREQYQECMGDVSNNNLLSLRRGNTLVAIFAAVFAFFPMLTEHDVLKGIVFLGAAFIALIMTFIADYIMQKMNVNYRIIYLLIILYYINLIFFGIYVSVLTNPGKPASIFPCILICSFLLYVFPPHFNLILTLCSLTAFIVSSYLVKDFGIWIYDVVNASIAGILGIYFSWYSTKLRLGLEISASKLEEERNSYVDQSITDELTQLKNRRDFTATFQRFLFNYRASDDWLCVALADIDFFKMYNDHYGHRNGDICLHGIGEALHRMSALGVYTARVGGEEFALLWFEQSPDHVNEVITNFFQYIRDLKIRHEKSKASEYVTMSVGVYIIRCGSYHDTQVLYDRADKALYTAKDSGRNRAIILGDEIEQYKVVLKDSD